MIVILIVMSRLMIEDGHDEDNLASKDLATWIGEDEMLGGRHLLKDAEDDNDDGDDADDDPNDDDHHHLSS